MFKKFAQSDYKKIAGLHLLAVFLIVLDRLLKAWVLAVKPFSSGLLALNFSFNPGLAFSLPLPPAAILIAVSLIILGLWFYYFKLLSKNRWQAGLIFAIVLGAESNLVDRLIYGGVIDYFKFGQLSSFNLADALIVLGLALWLLREIFNGNRPAVGPPDNKL
jgi:signal peptidase II